MKQTKHSNFRHKKNLLLLKICYNYLIVLNTSKIKIYNSKPKIIDNTF